MAPMIFSEILIEIENFHPQFQKKKKKSAIKMVMHPQYEIPTTTTQKLNKPEKNSITINKPIYL